MSSSWFDSTLFKTLFFHFLGEQSFWLTHLLVLDIHLCSDWVELSAQQSAQLLNMSVWYHNACVSWSILEINYLWFVTMLLLNTDFKKGEKVCLQVQQNLPWLSLTQLYTNPTQQVVWHSSLHGWASQNMLCALAEFCFGYVTLSGCN